MERLRPVHTICMLADHLLRIGHDPASGELVVTLLPAGIELYRGTDFPDACAAFDDHMASEYAAGRLDDQPGFVAARFRYFHPDTHDVRLKRQRLRIAQRRISLAAGELMQVAMQAAT